MSKGCQHVRASKLTLSKDVHRIVDLDVHVVADCGELIPLCRNGVVVLVRNLPARVSLCGELASDDDGGAILFGFVGLRTLVLESELHLGNSGTD